MCSHKDINVLLVPYEGVDDFMWGTSLAPSKILKNKLTQSRT